MNHDPVPLMDVEHFRASYGKREVLHGVSLSIQRTERLALIGPLGSGRTTLLRSLNRLNDMDPEYACSGRILFEGRDIRDKTCDPAELRHRVAFLNAAPSPLPKSIHDNISFGLKTAGLRNASGQEAAIENSLRVVDLWEQLKDHLHEPALGLNRGLQYRLCLARLLALDPVIILLDEPCAGLDPISTAQIEQIFAVLKQRLTIVFATNDNKQAARSSDRVAYLDAGELVEIGPTFEVFRNPKNQRTDDYLTGRG